MSNQISVTPRVLAMVLLSAGVSWAGSDRHGRDSSGPGITKELTVSGPTIIVVVAPASSQSASKDHQAEHLAHIEFALQDAKQCLAPLEVRVPVVPTNRVVLVDARKRVQVYPDQQTGFADPRGEAVILVKPGVHARTVLRGSNIIHTLVLSEAASYFDAPRCNPGADHAQ